MENRYQQGNALFFAINAVILSLINLPTPAARQHEKQLKINSKKSAYHKKLVEYIKSLS